MPYGTIKVDTITFTSGSSDVSVAISGLVQNPTFSGDVTVTGTVSGTIVRGNTVSGATVTGTAGQFGTLTGNTAGFTTVTGTTVTGTTANFATVSGTTVTGDTARFTTTTGVSGVFTSQLSGAIVTGDTFQGSNITGVSGVFTTRVSGATVTGNAIVGSTITGVSGVFTTVISGASGVIAGNITASAFIPTGSAVPTNGVYLPSANTVGIATNSSGTVFLNSVGQVSFGSGATTTYSQARFIVEGAPNSGWDNTSGGVVVVRNGGAVGAAVTLVPTAATGISGGTLGWSLYAGSSGAAIGEGSVGFYSHAAGDQRFYINPSGIISMGVTPANLISAGGVLQLKSGITFPSSQVASTNPNTLDDYEEGTWTPVINRVTSSPTVTYVSRTGSYVKIGKFCVVFWDITINTISGGAGSATISNLPFTVSSDMAGFSLILNRDNSAMVAGPAGTQLKGFFEKGQSYMHFQYDNSGANGFATNATDTNWSTSRSTGCGFYEV